MIIVTQKKAGFTLVEMMIVVAIMAILATIAAPNLQTYMTQRRLNGGRTADNDGPDGSKEQGGQWK